MTAADIPTRSIMRPTNDHRAATAARASRPLHVPSSFPPDAPPELIGRLAELGRLRQNLGQARAEISAKIGAVAERSAKQADAAAFSAAVRANQPDPGPVKEQQRGASLDDAERRTLGLRAAVGEVEAEIISLIEANRASWIAAAQPKLAAARTARARAQLALDTADAALTAQLLFERWLEEPKMAPRIPARSD